MVHLGEKEYHTHGPPRGEVYIGIFRMGLWAANTKPWEKRSIGYR